ncbi:reticulon-4a [Silurus meridionalis]|nr:reticulon-4a [Silurus meridionalis]XP_046710680.1 reticulon-4a [Silurus meridionalis]
MDNQISSTTDDLKNLQQADENLAPKELTAEVSHFSQCSNFDIDDILDLAGGAKDAIERHRKSEDQLMEIENSTSSQPEEEKAPAEAEALSSQLWDLLYWHNVQKTAYVFGATLSLLISLSLFSIISVSSYIALALLSVTICFRIYRGITDAFQKSQTTHPFEFYLERDVTLPADVFYKHSDMLLKQINATVHRLMHLFLVEDLVDSLKFALQLWVLTYVGSFFNGLTLLIIGDVAAFTCPVLYKKYKVQFDHYYGLVQSYFKDVVQKIQVKIYGLKNKAE